VLTARPERQTRLDGASQSDLRCTMPALNPRLTITLKPSTSAQLRTLSDLTGESQSALIAGLLEANEETLGRLITVLQAAQDAKHALTDDLADGMKKAQAQIERQLGLSLESFDVATKPLLDEAERVVRRRAKAVSRPAAARPVKAAPTPMSNRGVRLTTKKPKSSTGTRG
jgi:hypothetical protein